MGRGTASPALKIAAVTVLALSGALMGTSFKALKSASVKTAWPHTNPWQVPFVKFKACPNATTCVGPACMHPTMNSKTDPFTMHVFFMTVAFGLLGPVGAVTYYVLEDTLGVSHNIAKWVHGGLKFSALIVSILGYYEIYLSNGFWCTNTPDTIHFQSLHSYVGICVLAAYWLQGPLALLIFSNTWLLKPGGAARAAFLRGHVIVGMGCSMLSLVTIMLGVLAFGTKVQQWPSFNNPAVEPFVPMEIWYNYTRTGMVAFGTLVALGLVFALKPPPAPAETVAVKEPFFANSCQDPS